MIDRPVYCLTTDTDWASEYALDQFFAFVAEFSIRPTVFATHASRAVSQREASGAVEVGLHPNFFPGSSHGVTQNEVLDHVQALFPTAQAVRCHAAFDHSRLAHELYRRGFRYTSNVLLYLQPHLVPLRHGLGLACYPVFWEEDVHWYNLPGDWDVDRVWSAFLTPGLKILNVHAFMMAINACGQAHYEKSKPHITTLSASSCASLRHTGPGSATFLREVLTRLRDRGEQFLTLGEVAREYPVTKFLLPELQWLAQPVNQAQVKES